MPGLRGSAYLNTTGSQKKGQKVRNMSPENNEGKGPIEDQVKKVLSGLGGEAAEFLSRPAPDKQVQGSIKLGTLKTVILEYFCGPNCSGIHAAIIPFEAF